MLKVSLILICLVLGRLALGQNRAFLQFQRDEALRNPLISRSTEPVQLQYLQIPLRSLFGMASVSEESLPSFLISHQNGEVYFNWILNPEDKRYGAELERYLHARSIPFTRKQGMQGWALASRSFALYDNAQDRYYSFKTSTDRVGPLVMDKKWTSAEAMDAIQISKYLMDIQFEKILIMPEIFSVTTGGSPEDFGWSLRQITLGKTGKRIVPLFAIYDKEFMDELLKAHGETDPFKLVKEKIIDPFGEAMAEFIAKTGLAPDSPHSQNILIELDAEGKITGRFGLRDAGDVFVVKEFAKRIKNFPKLSAQTQFLEKGFLNWFDLFHQVPVANWYDYNRGSRDIGILVEKYYSSFNKKFKELTGLKVDHKPEKISWAQRHFSQEVQFSSADWIDVWLRGLLNSAGKKRVRCKLLLE